MSVNSVLRRADADARSSFRWERRHLIAFHTRVEQMSYSCYIDSISHVLQSLPYRTLITTGNHILVSHGIDSQTGIGRYSDLPDVFEDAVKV